MAFAVITRELEASAAYVTALEQLELSCVAMPVTRTAPARDPRALVRALDEGNYAAIVVASPRAAAALTIRGEAPLPEVWAVGPATARALAGSGIAAVQPAEAHDAASLAHVLLAERSLAGRRVLVPRAEDGRDEAISILRAAGVDVRDVVAYRTIAAPIDDPALVRGRDLLSSGDAAVCAVFAPSQVTALAGIVGPLARLRTTFAAIGVTTATALHDVGVTKVAVANSPTPGGIANAIAAVYPPRP
ncbi:MAG: uroporphyrinogen-III synthase [Kofleriaceae bacterium]